MSYDPFTRLPARRVRRKEGVFVSLDWISLVCLGILGGFVAIAVLVL